MTAEPSLCNTTTKPPWASADTEEGARGPVGWRETQILERWWCALREEGADRIASSPAPDRDEGRAHECIEVAPESRAGSPEERQAGGETAERPLETRSAHPVAAVLRSKSTGEVEAGLVAADGDLGGTDPGDGNGMAVGYGSS